MTIPRIVHNCWFGGGPRSEKIARCLASQRAKLPGYEVMEWTEETFDLDAHPFTRNAFRAGQFAHVSDMVRLIVLHRHGGFYLDTDVEVVRPFDDLLDARFVAGYMWECMLGTAVIGAEKENPVVAALLRPYLDGGQAIDFGLPNNHILTRHFIDHVPGFRLDGREWRGDGIHILDRYGFEQPSLGRRRNHAIHHLSASWRGESPLKRRLKSAVVRLLGLYLYRRIMCWNALRKSPLRPVYEQARRAGAAARG